jgi:citrate synthase
LKRHADRRASFSIGTSTSSNTAAEADLILKHRIPRRARFKRAMFDARSTHPVQVRHEISLWIERLRKMADLAPVCDVIEQRYFKVLSNRDDRWSDEQARARSRETLAALPAVAANLDEAETQARRYARPCASAMD